MLYAPEVQKRAQQELDKVTEGQRLPEFSDRASLPYIDAIYYELMRWMPPAPYSVPHRATEDDVYRGWLIPKGTFALFSC